MLDSLLEIEIAYSLLKVGDDKAKDPIDMHYEKLKTDIQVLSAFCPQNQNRFRFGYCLLHVSVHNL